MKVKVLEDTCIGCGACQALCEDVFEINEEGFATAKVDVVPEENNEACKDAAECCPVGAIVVED